MYLVVHSNAKTKSIPYKPEASFWYKWSKKKINFSKSNSLTYIRTLLKNLIFFNSPGLVHDTISLIFINVQVYIHKFILLLLKNIKKYIMNKTSLYDNSI
jgi:hypothetical protein